MIVSLFTGNWKLYIIKHWKLLLSIFIKHHSTKLYLDGFVQVSSI